MSKKSVIIAAALVAGTLAAAQLAYAGAPVSLTLAAGSAECTLSWHKDGVGFKPLIPGSSSSAYRITDIAGTITVDLTAVGNPVALAKSIYVRGTAKGGFTLTDAAGHYVQISNPEGSLNGDTTYVVQSSIDPAGTRLPVSDIPVRPTLNTDVQSVLPPKVSLGVTGIGLVALPEFATVMNQTFGDGAIEPGDPLANCTGTVGN